MVTFFTEYGRRDDAADVEGVEGMDEGGDLRYDPIVNGDVFYNTALTHLLGAGFELRFDQGNDRAAVADEGWECGPDEFLRDEGDVH